MGTTGQLIGTMITATRKAHALNGLWNANGGYEFNLALIAATLAIEAGRRHQPEQALAARPGSEPAPAVGTREAAVPAGGTS